VFYKFSQLLGKIVLLFFGINQKSKNSKIIKKFEGKTSDIIPS